MWKIISKYLSGTLSHDLLLSSSPSTHKFSLRAYCDFNWASDPEDQKSIYGACIYFEPNLVSYSTKNQPLVAKSNADAGYGPLAHTTYELLWLESFLHELYIAFSDKLSALLLSCNPIFHACINHVELDIHFVREKVI